MAVKVAVTYHGFFFTGNPVGRMRQNLYRDVLPEVAQVAAAAAAANLSPGRGVVTGAMRDSIEPRLVQASRFNNFTGKARVIAGARGAAPGELRNRAAAALVNKKYRFMYRGAALAQSWVSGHISWIGDKLTRGLT
jgi:hypothetical protein